jgi:hypothetical protein
MAKRRGKRGRISLVEGPDTGIYRAVRAEPATDAMADFNAACIFNLGNPMAVDEIERAALAVVAPFTPPDVLAAIRMTAMTEIAADLPMDLFRLPDDAPPIAHDASRALLCLWMGQWLAREGRPDDALRYAMHAGRLYERSVVRSAEPFALRGKRQLKALEAARADRAGGSTGRRETLRQEALTLWRANTAKSLRWVQGQLAEKYAGEPGYSRRSIEAHTAGLKRHG